MRPRIFAGSWLALIIFMAICLGASSSPEAEGAGGNRWYTAAVEEGETQGYRWSIRVKGPKGEPLRRLCVLAGFIAPPKPDVPYAEGDNSQVCGEVVMPTDSVLMSATLGSSGTTFLVAVYRPLVRKVSFLLSTGQRRVFRPHLPHVPNRAARGIPRFRFVVATFDRGACVRRVTTFDGRGDVVSREGEPCA